MDNGIKYTIIAGYTQEMAEKLVHTRFQTDNCVIDKRQMVPLPNKIRDNIIKVIIFSFGNFTRDATRWLLESGYPSAVVIYGCNLDGDIVHNNIASYRAVLNGTFKMDDTVLKHYKYNDKTVFLVKAGRILNGNGGC